MIKRFVTWLPGELLGHVAVRDKLCWWVSRRASAGFFLPFTLFLVKSRRVAPRKMWGICMGICELFDNYSSSDSRVPDARKLHVR